MRWMFALIMSLATAPAATAASEDEAIALVLDLVHQVSEAGGLAVDDPDALAARTDSAFTLFEQIADEQGVLWSMSYGVDVDASSVRRHDADGNPVPIDPATLDDADRLPSPDAGCEAPVTRPLSPASTADASWQVCTSIEDNGDGPFYIGFSELLYGQGGNFRRIRLGVAVSSPDLGYITAMEAPATQLLHELMDAIRADALPSWPPEASQASE
jgi:hypothetical protein